MNLDKLIEALDADDELTDSEKRDIYFAALAEMEERERDNDEEE